MFPSRLARVWNIRCWLHPFSPKASESRPLARPPRGGEQNSLFSSWIDCVAKVVPPLLAMLIRFAPCCWMARWRDWIMTQESALNCRPYSVNSVYRNTRRVRKLYQSLIFTAYTLSRVHTPDAENLRETGFNYSLTGDGRNKSHPLHLDCKTG